MKRSAMAIVTLLLAACAASGVKVSDAQIQAFQAGKTTVDEVVAALGQPTTRMRLADGSTTLHYTYAEASVRAASYVPIVGMFAGGTDVRSRMVMLNFDAGGKLLNSTTSESQYGTGVGASAGQIDAQKVQQPRQ